MEKAYLIMAHKNPGQVHRLVSRLIDGSSDFFIHIDKKTDSTPFETSLRALGSIVHFTERFDATWGGYGLIKPFLCGLKMVQQTTKKFERIILLSGQDYPIKSNADINHFFEQSPYSVFVDFFPIPNFEKWPGRDRGGWYRVDKYFFGLKWYHFLFSKSLNLAATFLPFLRRSIPNAMKPYTGQTWWILDPYALNYILDYVEQHPEYIAFHRNTFVADELFVQMILANSTDPKLLQSIENNDRRFIIWEKQDSAHPNILRTTDFDTIRSSTDLYARKFDEGIDGAILDLIDTEILQPARPSTEIGSDDSLRA